MRLVAVAAFVAGVLVCVITALLSSLAPILGSPIQVGYLDTDNSVLSSDFERYATERLGMELVEGDEAWLNNELVEKRISGIIEVPAGLEAAVLVGRDGALQVTYMDDYANKVFLQNYLELYMNSVDVLASAAQGDVGAFEALLEGARAQSVSITTASPDEQRLLHSIKGSGFVTGSGFFLFIAALLVIALATIIYEDRANHTFDRVRATNVHTLSYVVGVCAAGFLSIAVMAVVFLVYCAVSGLGAVVPLGPVTVLCLLFVLVCVAFALVCGMLFESRSSILWAVIAISTIFSMLGGAWFPISYSPEFMQQIAHITPQFWFIDAIYQMQNGSSIAWIASSGILALFALLCFLVAGIRFASSRSSAQS
jgi:ABC-2 type transport system permease protein